MLRNHKTLIGTVILIWQVLLVPKPILWSCNFAWGIYLSKKLQLCVSTAIRGNVAKSQRNLYYLDDDKQCEGFKAILWNHKKSDYLYDNRNCNINMWVLHTYTYGGVAKSQKVSTVVIIWSPMYLHCKAVLGNPNFAWGIYLSVCYEQLVCILLPAAQPAAQPALALLRTFNILSLCPVSRSSELRSMNMHIYMPHVHACGHTCTRHVATCACMLLRVHACVMVWPCDVT